MTAGLSRASRRTGWRAFACVVALVVAYPLVSAPIAHAAEIPSEQWYLDLMRAEETWKKSTGEGIKVAVIDTGVNSSTPSLRGQVVKGLDATDAAGEATDDYDGHGTTMAELIAGTGAGGGLRGLAPGAKIIPFRIATDSFPKDVKVNAWADAVAMRAAADSDAHIISVSIGNEFLEAREMEAVKYAHSKGKLVFAAVGNTGNKANKPEYPAAYDEVVGVAAIGRDGKVAEYSQHGDFVDIAAPGADVPRWCDSSFTRYCEGGGTSAATALASASAALIWSAHPDWTANQVLRVMFDSAGRGDAWKDDSKSQYLGHGVVRPNAHITRGIGKPGPPDVSPLTHAENGDGASAGPASPSAPTESQEPKGGGESSPETTGSGKTADGRYQLVLIVGTGVAVAIAGTAFAVVRRRRAT
ncbi:S8 family serine peptidase [Streptomyces sp. I6]|uniref:S8 family serine peptidase n=1 Tax=Streptomyces sp. I6 TaxID=2483113 RepID=UPI000F45CABA|nr:S8 family serine peptidase [Streptomyces sp. I6]RNL72994.1 serine protease [Streptomyces sp. I6]